MNSFDIIEQYEEQYGHEIWYQGIAGLRKSGVKFGYTQEQIDEIIKCSKDYKYFIKNYVQITHPDGGIVPFNLWDFQETMLDIIHENRFTIFKNPRQSGKTQSSGSYLLWYILFHNNKTVGIVANKGDMALEIMQRIKDMYINLPVWMQRGVKRWAKKSISFDNGSRIVSQATSGSALRGYTINILYWDECVGSDTTITVKSKRRGLIETITMGELENRLKGNTTKEQCEICGEHYSYLNGDLTRHIKNKHNLSMKDYYFDYIFEGDKKCPICGKDKKFINIKGGLRKTCGEKSCVYSFSGLNRIGKKHSEKTKLKIGKGNKGKIISPATRKKMSDSRLKSNKRFWTKQRKKDHSIAVKKWCKENPELVQQRNLHNAQLSKTTKTKQKRIKTNFKKYGVANSYQIERVKNKQKKYWKQNKNNILKKMQTTCIKKYGVPNCGFMAENSKISNKLFWQIYKQLPNNLKKKTYFKELNKEFHKYNNKQNYFYDFVISNIKFCIEFNGDYWHCNPKKYDKLYYHKQCQLYAKDIWKRDDEKKLILENLGFKVLTIWENEYKKFPEKIVEDILEEINVLTK